MPPPAVNSNNFYRWHVYSEPDPWNDNEGLQLLTFLMFLKPFPMAWKGNVSEKGIHLLLIIKYDSRIYNIFDFLLSLISPSHRCERKPNENSINHFWKWIRFDLYESIINNSNERQESTFYSVYCVIWKQKVKRRLWG